MTIPNMAFNPVDGLRNKSTYPTDPITEDALRDAVQEGMDQLRDYINTNITPKMLDKTGDTATGTLSIDPGGTTNAGFELGSKSGASTPFFDFNSSGNNTDYDSRIIASGGSGTGGQGTLNFLAGVLQFNSKPVATALSGGQKIQSGSIAAGATGQFTVTFPTAFSTAPIVTANYFGNGVNSSVPVDVVTVTSTAVTFYINGFVAGGSIHWHAIGT